MVPFTLEKPGEYACLLCLLCSYWFPKSKFHEDQNSRYTSSTQNNKQHLRGTLHHWGNKWMKPCDQDKYLIKMQRTGFLVQKTHFPNRKVLELSRRKRKETQKRTQLRSPCVTFWLIELGVKNILFGSWGLSLSSTSCVDQVACLLRGADISCCGVRCLP